MMKKEQKFSRSPSKLIILYILITFFVLIIGIRYYFKQKEEIRNEAYTNLSVIAEMKANQISNWRNERLGDANVIFNSKFLVSDLKKMFDNSSDVILKSTIISHFSAYYNFYHYKDIIIFDTNAFIKYSLDSKLSKLSKISFAQLKNAGKDKKPVFSEIYICDLCNDLHLDIVIPLFEKDVLFGGIILRIDPEEFLFPLIQTWPTTSPTSETLLIIKEGDGVVYLNELRHQKNTALKLKFKIDSSNYYVPSVMAVMGKTGLVEGLDYRGVKVLSDIRKITDSQWYMIAKVDLDEIYAPVKEKAINISILTGLVLISFAIGFIWVWTNQKKSIRIQHLEEERKHQALIKHFDYIVKYANDILLLTDRDFNIVEANDSAVQAFGYSSEELVKLNVRDLRAPETLPQLKEQLKNLSITGRAFYETIYKRKDGTTFPVEASIRTVEIEGAVFYQAIVKDITERKQAERALKESEIKFRSLFENAILGIYRTTPEGQIIECNPALSRMLGFDNLEDLAKRNLELIGFEPGYSRSEFKKKIEKEGEIIGLETAWIKKDGTSIYVSENTKAIRDDDGKFLFYEGTVEDITERKRAEELLMREKELYIDLVKSMPSGVYRVKIFSPETWKKNAWNSSENAPYSMELVSDRFCEILGVSKETYAKNPGILNDLVHPEDKAVFAKVHEDAMSSLTKFSWDGRIVNSGKILWVHFESLPRALENGDVIWTGSVQDITERKQAEEALHLKNSVFDTSIAANSIADVNGVITEVNDAFLRLWDYLVKDEVIGKPITHFLNDPDEAIKIVDALNNTGEWEGNYIAKKKDGSTFIAYGLASIVKDEAGKTKGYQSSVLDMTERMKAEESIKNLSLRNEAILSSVPDIIMEVDNNKVYTWANSSGKEFFGDDVIGKEAKFYFEGEQETYKNVEPLFTGDENIFYLESWQRRQDGEKRILAWWCRVLKDTEGNVTGALSSAQDITEIKKAEQELFESENLFRNMNINSPLGMHFYELNDDNKLIFVGANPAADKILEVDNSQFIGKTIEEAFPPLIQTEVPQRYREAAEKGTLWSTEQIDYKD
ncbi:MAG: PAS domain S-box protein, partial [Ignavibacteriae bacterium]|nr:PAS domain S-box protein [Ignavibacteriota bacterium]